MENYNLMPDSLKKIIFNVQNQKNIDSQILVEIIKHAKVSEKDLNQFESYNHSITESYGRSKIFECADFTVFVMSWSPLDFTAIHSHGHSEWGAVLFLNDTNHRLYNAKGKSIELAQKGIVPKGSIVPVNGKLVHAMGNLTDKPFQTLHIYGTNKQNGITIEDSIVYELEKNQRRTSFGSAFINIGEHLCKTTEAGIETNLETLLDYLPIVQPFYKKNKLLAISNRIDEFIKNPKLYFEPSQVLSKSL